MADVDAGTLGRLIDDLVQPPADGVVLEDVAEDLPVDLVVARGIDEAEGPADHVVPYGEQVGTLARAQLGGRDPRIRALDVGGGGHVSALGAAQPSPRADQHRPWPGRRRVGGSPRSASAAQGLGAVTAQGGGGLRPVVPPRSAGLARGDRRV